MKKLQTKDLRAISFGEMFTGRNLYIVVGIFALAAIGVFILVGSDIYTIMSFAGDLK